MKSNSDHYPKQITQSAGKTLVAYDITETARTEMDGSIKASYNYEYVAIEGTLTRAKIIDAIIADVHSKDAELALINNEIASPGTAAYTEYQVLRAYAKNIAEEILG